MPVVSVDTDFDALQLTFVAEFDAPVERVWQVWEDPRQLERWWGPPTWPATFDRYEFEPGGSVRYHMTGPDGTKAHGWWTVRAVEVPRRLEFIDGFAGEDGEPVDPEDYTVGVVTLEEVDGDDGQGGTGRMRMTVQSTFLSREQLTTMSEMGIEEGMTLAMGQIDGLLAE